MVLKLHNTLGRKLQVFTPVIPGTARLYTCGPTVYDYAQIGNFRTFIFEDLLRRYLKFKGYAVTQVMNLTDVDDKTIRKSRQEGKPLPEVTERYAKAFFEDATALNIEPAEVYPRATAHVQEMIALIQHLLKKGYAYRAPDNCIYFSIAKFRKYGELAGIKVDELQAGASGRILKDEYEKEQVADFALWKAWDAQDGDVAWESPFGNGRPGWHIECSAMSAKHLTKVFEHGYAPAAFVTLDIHTGGEDNMFPHHQDEIAQSEGCFGKKFTKYWLHSAHLLVDGKKMSKSLGNFYTLRDLLAKGYDPTAIRYVLLSTHYRQQINFTLAGIDAAKAALQRLQDFILALKAANGTADTPKVPQLVARCRKAFEKAMDNDLDTSPALAALFALVKDVNILMEKKPLSRPDAGAVLTLLRELNAVLGVMQFEEASLAPALQKLIDDREAARKRKDWQASDRLRDALAAKGIIVEDTPQGPRWKRAR